jgi:hypothetical protein
MAKSFPYNANPGIVRRFRQTLMGALVGTQPSVMLITLDAVLRIRRDPKCRT